MRTKKGYIGLIEDLTIFAMDFRAFEQPGILSKKVTLNYRGESRQPWLDMICLEDEKYSFKAHELELGPKEAVYWNLAAQHGKEIVFEGYKDMFYSSGLGKLRGYLSLKDGYPKTGLWIKKGRVRRVRPKEEMNRGLPSDVVPAPLQFLDKKNLESFLEDR